MKPYSMIFAIVCLNLAAATLTLANVFPMAIPFNISASDVTSWFSVDVFDLALAAGGGVAVFGVIMALFKSYTYAAGAVTLWVASVILTPVRLIVNGFPTMLENMLATVVPELVWFRLIVFAFTSMIIFIFVAEIISGKQIT